MDKRYKKLTREGINRERLNSLIYRAFTGEYYSSEISKASKECGFKLLSTSLSTDMSIGLNFKIKGFKNSIGFIYNPNKQNLVFVFVENYKVNEWPTRGYMYSTTVNFENELPQNIDYALYIEESFNALSTKRLLDDLDKGSNVKMYINKFF